jgi:hypothetical protein
MINHEPGLISEHHVQGWVRDRNHAVAFDLVVHVLDEQSPSRLVMKLTKIGSA